MKDADDRRVEVATIEPSLEQVGQEAPAIRVALRHWPDGEWRYSEILRLSLIDAQELAAALNFLAETAERA